MQYVYALNPAHRFTIPGHSRREVPRQAVDIVNPGMLTLIHRNWHTLININNMKFQLIV